MDESKPEMKSTTDIQMSNAVASSFNEIYTSYYKKSFFFAKSYVHDDLAAEDIASESLIKSFDFKVLLEPFEKQLYLPAIFIKFSNLKRRYMHRIGYECKFSFLFFIPIFNQPKWLWVILFRIESCQKYTHV